MEETLSFERFEYKYFIPDDRSEDVRRFVAPYLVMDPYCAREPDGAYTITNLYWDTPDLGFFRAHRDGAPDRFKLRIRTYGKGAGSDRAYFEVKRKVRQVIVKHRAAVSREHYDAVLDGDTRSLDPASERFFGEFMGRLLAYRAQPNYLVRYQREAYVNVFDEDARVTFDRALCYQPATSTDLRGIDRAYTYVDSSWGCRGVPLANLIELKFTRFYPSWMRELVRRFELSRVQFSKYLTTIVHHREIVPQDYDGLPSSVLERAPAFALGRAPGPSPADASEELPQVD